MTRCIIWITDVKIELENKAGSKNWIFYIVLPPKGINKSHYHLLKASLDSESVGFEKFQDNGKQNKKVVMTKLGNNYATPV